MTVRKQKCLGCETGTLELWQWGNYPCHADWICSNPNCYSHALQAEAAEYDYQEWLQDTHVDHDGTRHLY